MTNIGQVVTLNMKNGKCIQGRIKSIDADKQTVLIERPFLNGKPMGGQERNFPICSILSFRVLDIKTEQAKNRKVVYNTGATESTCAPNNAAVAKGINTGLTEHLVKIHKPLMAPHVVGDCPLNTAKYSEAVRRVNFEKETIGATTNARKSSGSSVDIVSDTNTPLHAEQQQHSSYSSSSSSSSSPITKPLAKLNRLACAAKGRHVLASSIIPKLVPYGAGSPHRGKGNRGPIGIPELDVTYQNNRDKKTNEDLIKPIDFDLNEDFDFEKNLEIFRNYEKNAKSSDRKEALAQGAQFAQKNYEHFENVISDPSRVTSWITKTHDQFVAARFEKTVNGQRMPFLKPCDKEKFLQRAEPYLGSDIFHVMIADRLVMFVWNIIDKFKIMVNQMVVLDSAAVNTFLTTMFLRHISNRACQTVVYSCLLGQYNLPHVLQVHNVQELPKRDVQIVVVLGPLLLGSVKQWIKNLGPSAHLICIEKPPELIKNEHILMVGVGTDNSSSPKQKKADSLRCVTDIGIPFTWMDAYSAASLSRAFATQNMLLC